MLGNVNFPQAVPKNASSGRETVNRSTNRGGLREEDSLDRYTSDGYPSRNTDRGPSQRQIELANVAQNARMEMMGNKVLSPGLGGVSGMYAVKTTANAKKTTSRTQKLEEEQEEQVPAKRVTTKTVTRQLNNDRSVKGKTVLSLRKNVVVTEPEDDFFEDDQEPEPIAVRKQPHVKSKSRIVQEDVEEIEQEEERPPPRKKKTVVSVQAKKTLATRKRVVQPEPEEDFGEEENDAASNIRQDDYEDLLFKYNDLASQYAQMKELATKMMNNNIVIKQKTEELYKRVTGVEQLWKHKINEMTELHDNMKAMSDSIQTQFAEIHAKMGDVDLPSEIANFKFSVKESMDRADTFWAVTRIQTPMFNSIPKKSITDEKALNKLIAHVMPCNTPLLCCQPREIIIGIGEFFRCQTVHPTKGHSEIFYVPIHLDAKMFPKECVPDKNTLSKAGWATCLNRFDVVFPDYVYDKNYVDDVDEYENVDGEEEEEEVEEEEEETQEEEEVEEQKPKNGSKLNIIVDNEEEEEQ